MAVAPLHRAARTAVFLLRLHLAVLCVGLASPAFAGINPAGTLTLAWNPVSHANFAGYNLYYGVVSRLYTNVVPVGDTETVTITGLVPGVEYFLAVTTRLVDGVESAYSDEISFVLPRPAPALKERVSPSGQVNLVTHAPPGHTYDVLATQDFALWLAIGTITVDDSGTLAFTDPDAPLFPSRFYRLHETTYTAPGSLPVFNRVTSSDSGLKIQITGQVGHTYEVLTTQDFQVWGVIGSVTVGTLGTGTASVPANPYFPISYYRLREIDYASAQTIVPFTFYMVLPGFIQILFDVQPGPIYTFLESGDLNTWTAIGSLTFAGSGTSVYNDTFDPTDLPRTYRISVSY